MTEQRKLQINCDLTMNYETMTTVSSYDLHDEMQGKINRRHDAD